MSELAGKRIFIVEDETLVLFNLEDILHELGCTILAEAMSLSEAQRLAVSVERPDAAILDVNLGGQKIFPAAEILAARGVPILFATGYGRDGLLPEWQDRPVIVKPYTQREIAVALGALLETSHGDRAAARGSSQRPSA